MMNEFFLPELAVVVEGLNNYLGAAAAEKIIPNNLNDPDSQDDYFHALHEALRHLYSFNNETSSGSSDLSDQTLNEINSGHCKPLNTALNHVYNQSVRAPRKVRQRGHVNEQGQQHTTQFGGGAEIRRKQ